MKDALICLVSTQWHTCVYIPHCQIQKLSTEKKNPKAIQPAGILPSKQ